MTFKFLITDESIRKLIQVLNWIDKCPQGGTLEGRGINFTSILNFKSCKISYKVFFRECLDLITISSVLSTIFRMR